MKTWEHFLITKLGSLFIRDHSVVFRQTFTLPSALRWEDCACAPCRHLFLFIWQFHSYRGSHPKGQWWSLLIILEIMPLKPAEMSGSNQSARLYRKTHPWQLYFAQNPRNFNFVEGKAHFCCCCRFMTPGFRNWNIFWWVTKSIPP